MRILITGAAGGVGAEVSYELAKRHHAVVAMIHRKREIVRYNGELVKLQTKPLNELIGGEVFALKADVSLAGFGLSDIVFKELQESIDVIVNCAARIEFGRDPEYYKPVNIDGTKNVLDFAINNNKKIPLLHVSTAFVCGEINGLFREVDFDMGQDFVNTYEESKFKAEIIVRDAFRKSKKIVILRPSIIVGASHNGSTSTYNTIYPILRVLTAGKVSSIPAENNAFLNLIPVDHVSDAIVQLVEKIDEIGGRTFHVVNDKSITMRDLSNVLAENPHFYVPRYIDPDIFEPDCLSVEEKRYYDLVVKPYITYMKRRIEFSNDDLRKTINMPKSINGVELLRRALNYCISTGYMGAPRDMSISDFKEMRS